MLLVCAYVCVFIFVAEVLFMEQGASCWCVFMCMRQFVLVAMRCFLVEERACFWCVCVCLYLCL